MIRSVLTVGENHTYRFCYTQGALKSDNFSPFGSMDELYAVYESEALFPLFSNRLLPVSRPEYQRQMRWLDIKETKDISLYMLSMTGGIRATDTLEVFECPVPNREGQYEVDFFAHGLRHLAKHAIERVNGLTKGERLFPAPDIQNEFDSKAILLRTGDPVEFAGYCPRYLSPDFERLADENGPMSVRVTVERVNQDAPLNLRLLCKLVAPWPADFHPCSGDDFEPLVELSDGQSEGSQTSSKLATVNAIRN